MTSQKKFFHVKGTLEEGALSYIERPAVDTKLIEMLKRRELCMVLAPRQTGKSSLMVHVRVKLASEGIRGAIVDFQNLGAKARAEVWFGDVCEQIERSLKLDADAGAWWEEHSNLGATQRFSVFLEDVVLGEISDPVVIFFDEVDTVLKHPFSDDFFTTLRSLHNARAVNPTLQRLTFALLGVTTPSSLIKDTSRTPFNVGESLELPDFDQSSAGAFREVLGPGCDPLVDRIFYWTGGQPLLVQELSSKAHAWPEEERTAERIDQQVKESYFDLGIEKDAHLLFIRNYLVASDQTRAVLGTYADVLAGDEVREDPDSPVHASLKIAGVVKSLEGKLTLRNRIYSSRFDRKWVELALRDLRPYEEALAAWLGSDKQDTSRLLEGEGLQEAKSWIVGRPAGEDESAFVRESEAHVELKRVRQTRILRGFASVVAVLASFAVWSAIQAMAAREVAVESQLTAENAWAGEEAQRHRAEESQIDAEVSRDAARVAQRTAEKATAEAEESQLDAEVSRDEARVALRTAENAMAAEAAQRRRAEALLVQSKYDEAKLRERLDELDQGLSAAALTEGADHLDNIRRLLQPELQRLDIDEATRARLLEILDN